MELQELRSVLAERNASLSSLRSHYESLLVRYHRLLDESRSRMVEVDDGAAGDLRALLRDERVQAALSDNPDKQAFLFDQLRCACTDFQPLLNFNHSQWLRSLRFSIMSGAPRVA